MATGVARTLRNKDLPAISQPSMPANADITLSYAGKRDERDILRTPLAITRNIWSGNVDANGKIPNYLYYGDNLPILAALLHNPHIRGQVRLVYIDPPYATRSIFQSRTQETS